MDQLVSKDINRDFFSPEKITRILDGRLLVQDGYLNRAPGKSERFVTGFCVDSRKAFPGVLFFALKGESVDGSHFQKDAFVRGALGAVTGYGKGHLPKGPGDKFVIEVDDPLSSLQRLAEYRRKELNPFTIAITGTNGKTTTKDFTSSIMTGLVDTLATHGNENSQVGLPLTLLRLHENHRVVVLEAGMSQRGELKRLSRISDPDIVLLTNVGPAHLETLESTENVKLAKLEIIPRAGRGRFVLMNADDPILASEAEKLVESYEGTVVTYGLKKGDFRPDKVEIDGNGCCILHTTLWGTFRIPIPGLHNGYNALASALASFLLGATSVEIKSGIENASLQSMRMEELFVGGVRILNDAYNANPVSVGAALNTIAGISPEKGGRRFVVLGEMLELGKNSVSFYRETINRIMSLPLDFVILVGEAWKAAISGKDRTASAVRIVKDVEEATDLLSKKLRVGDVILLKGSRGAEIERIAALLKENFPLDISVGEKVSEGER